jgi:hypothetical protein
MDFVLPSRCGRSLAFAAATRTPFRTMITLALQLIRRTPTMRLLVWTLCAFPIAYLFEFFAGLAVGRSHFAYKLFEVVGAVYAWTIIAVLWAFLIVGPFRPQTEFSLRGECRQRARIFFVALAMLLTLVVIYAICIAVQIGGGTGGA